MKKLLLVANRLPWSITNGEDGTRLTPSPGGLATALRQTEHSKDAHWIGWPGLCAEDVAADPKNIQAVFKNEPGVQPVWIPRDIFTGFYEGFSNGVLWPLFHYQMDKMRLETDRDWLAYVEATTLFAKAIRPHLSPKTTVWIHDYQLMLLPAMLRAIQPKARIGFFLHTPFPSPEVFKVLPWKEELLKGLLGADLIGFHATGYLQQFELCLNQFLDLRPNSHALTWKDRPVRCGAFGLGIDPAPFEEAVKRKSVVKRVEYIRSELNDRKIILGVDRLDYTKGIPRRLLALERFLQTNPEWCGKVHYIQLAVPTRESLEQYADYRQQVNELTGRINGAFGTPTWTPIHLMHDSVPFDELTALYRAADVMMVTPLRDGMNLVALEFCASRTDNAGILILSEFAGAAIWLRDALLVNPYDGEGMSAALKRALEMSPLEASQRMQALRKHTSSHNVHLWAKTFLAKLQAPESVNSAWAFTPTELIHRKIREARRRSNRNVLFLDYDGTLTPIRETPGEAAPGEDVISLLQDLCFLPHAEIHIVSGRPKDVLEAWFGHLPIHLHGEHGIWKKSGLGKPWKMTVKTPGPWRETAREIMVRLSEDVPGSFVEEKDFSLAWHFRQVGPSLAKEAEERFRHEVHAELKNWDVEILPGNKVLEVRQRGIHKGLAVDSGVKVVDTFVFAAGDDVTDEDLFKAMPSSAVTIHVGPGPTRADFTVPKQNDVRELLIWLKKELSR